MLRIKWMLQSDVNANRREVFRWWEARRLNYNLLLLIVGIITWVLVMIAGSHAVEPGEDFEEPIMMIFGPFLYGILANICYTFGPLFDVTFYRGQPRVKLFKGGLDFLSHSDRTSGCLGGDGLADYGIYGKEAMSLNTNPILNGQRERIGVDRNHLIIFQKDNNLIMLGLLSSCGFS